MAGGFDQSLADSASELQANGMRAALDAEAPELGAHARLEQIGGRDWVSADRRPVVDGAGAADEQSIRALK